MAGRCGCGSNAGANIQGQLGVAASGAGTANDPAVVRFDPRKGNILGNGLQWNEAQKKLSVRISNDQNNGLQWGSDGGLWGPQGGEGPGPGPSPQPGATVQGLPGSNVVAGAHGGGYMLTGDSTVSAYRSALQLGVDAVYVPVRALGDGSVVVWPHEDTTLQRLTQGFTPALGEDFTDATPDFLDALRWRHVPIMAGQYKAASGTDPLTGLSAELDLEGGYFASGEAPQQGGTFLCDVASEIGGAVVLILHVEQTAAYTELMRVIRNHGLDQSVIVVSSTPEIIETYVGENLAAGVYNADSGPVPPAQDIADLGAGWAVIDTARGDTMFTNYKDAGLQVLMYGARYHSDYERVNTTLEIRGAVTPDPVYYNGPATSYAYRSDSLDFTGRQHRPGWFIHHRKLEDNGPLRRTRLGTNGGYWLIDRESTWRTWYPDTDNASNVYGTYYVQVGNACPIVEGNDPANSLAVFFTFNFHPEPNMWTAEHSFNIAFGVPTDHPMSDANEPGNRTELDQGYVYREYWDGRIELLQLNGTEPTETLAEGRRPESGNGGRHERAIGLAEDHILVSQQGSNQPIADGFRVEGTPSYHGGYVYIGRRDFPGSAEGVDGRGQFVISQFDTYTPYPQQRW